MEDSATNRPTDLREVLRPIRARLWLILIFVSLSTAVTYYHYSKEPKQYSASTTLYVGSTDPTQLANPNATDRVTTDLATLMHSNSVAFQIAKILHYKSNPLALTADVSAAPVTGSDFITVTAVSGSPVAAAALANAAADAFVTNRTNDVRQQAAGSVAQDEASLAQLPNTTTYSAQRASLLASIEQMQAIKAEPNSSGISHINTAFPPGAPSAPNPKQDAIFAFVITLMLSIVGAYGLDRLDRRIRRVDDVEPIFGHPVLAVVPHASNPAPTSDSAALLPEEGREPFRKIRTNVALAGIDQPPRSIVITSAVAREGKSTVTRNLALAYRDAGLSVCVIDCDLRKPDLSDLMDVSIVPGLTDVVVGDETLDGAFKYAAVGVPGLRTLARLRHRSAERTGTASSTDEGDLIDVGSVVVLPSGSECSHPAVVLGSDQMRKILAKLSEDFDVVLIDTSPLVAVSDAVPLLSAVDGIILVARLGMTTRDAAEELVSQVRRISGANLLGIVVNDAQGREAGVKPYKYGHTRTRATV